MNKSYLLTAQKQNTVLYTYDFMENQSGNLNNKLSFKASMPQ